MIPILTNSFQMGRFNHQLAGLEPKNHLIEVGKSLTPNFRDFGFHLHFRYRCILQELLVPSTSSWQTFSRSWPMSPSLRFFLEKRRQLEQKFSDTHWELPTNSWNIPPNIPKYPKNPKCERIFLHKQVGFRVRCMFWKGMLEFFLMVTSFLNVLDLHAFVLGGSSQLVRGLNHPRL